VSTTILSSVPATRTEDPEGRIGRERNSTRESFLSKPPGRPLDQRFEDPEEEGVAAKRPAAGGLQVKASDGSGIELKKKVKHKRATKCGNLKNPDTLLLLPQ